MLTHAESSAGMSTAGSNPFPVKIGVSINEERLSERGKPLQKCVIKFCFLSFELQIVRFGFEKFRFFTSQLASDKVEKGKDQ